MTCTYGGKVQNSTAVIWLELCHGCINHARNTLCYWTLYNLWSLKESDKLCDMFSDVKAFVKRNLVRCTYISANKTTSLISSFCRVLNVACNLLGCSPAHTPGTNPKQHRSVPIFPNCFGISILEGKRPHGRSWWKPGNAFHAVSSTRAKVTTLNGGLSLYLVAHIRGDKENQYNGRNRFIIVVF
jgi:hypothetical protein